MNNLTFSVSQLGESFAKLVTKGYEVSSQWGSRVLKILQPAVRPLSEQMHKNPVVAIAVFTVANAVFIGVLSLLTKQKSDDRTEAGNIFKRVIKPIFVELVLIGGSVAAYNAILSKVTNYRLSHEALAAITASALVFRMAWKMVCNHLGTTEGTKVQLTNESKEKKSVKEAGATSQENSQSTKASSQGISDTQQPLTTNIDHQTKTSSESIVEDEVLNKEETTAPPAYSKTANRSKIEEKATKLGIVIDVQTARKFHIDLETAVQCVEELKNLQKEMEENGFKDPEELVEPEKKAQQEAEAQPQLEAEQQRATEEAEAQAKLEAEQRQAREEAEAQAQLETEQQRAQEEAKVQAQLEAEQQRVKEEAERQALEDAKAQNAADAEAAEKKALEEATKNFYNYIDNFSEIMSGRQRTAFSRLHPDIKLNKLRFLSEKMFLKYIQKNKMNPIDHSLNVLVINNFVKSLIDNYSEASFFDKMYSRLDSREKMEYADIK